MLSSQNSVRAATPHQNAAPAPKGGWWGSQASWGEEGDWRPCSQEGRCPELQGPPAAVWLPSPGSPPGPSWPSHRLHSAEGASQLLLGAGASGPQMAIALTTKAGASLSHPRAEWLGQEWTGPELRQDRGRSVELDVSCLPRRHVPPLPKARGGLLLRAAPCSLPWHRFHPSWCPHQIRTQLSLLTSPRPSSLTGSSFSFFTAVPGGDRWASSHHQMGPGQGLTASEWQGLLPPHPQYILSPGKAGVCPPRNTDLRGYFHPRPSEGRTLDGQLVSFSAVGMPPLAPKHTPPSAPP